MSSTNPRIVRTYRGKSHATTADARDLNPRTVCGRDAANMAAVPGATAPTCQRCAAKVAAEPAPAVPVPAAQPVPAVPAPRRSVPVAAPRRVGDVWDVESITEVVLYLRLSNDEPDATSIAQQDHECREYAARRGWTVLDVFTDDGVSGTTFVDERTGAKGGAAMLDGIRAGRVPAILARNIDRYSRSDEGTPRFRRMINAYGVLAVTCDGKVLNRDDVGTNVEAMFSAQYAKDIAEKARKGAVQRAREGRLVTGKPPYGYRTVETVHGKYIAPHPETAEILSDIVRRVIAGAPIDAIVIDLNRRGVLSPADQHRADMVKAGKFGAMGPRGTKWSNAVVRDMLTSPACTGVVMIDPRPAWQRRDENGRRIKAKTSQLVPFRDDAGNMVKCLAENTEPVVSDDDHARVVAAIASRSTGKQQSRRTDTMLRGIAKCGECETNLTHNARKGGKSARYRCPNRDCAAPVTVTAPALESFVLEMVRAKAGGFRPLVMISAGTDTARERRGLEDRITALETKLDETRNASRRERLNAQLDGLYDELSALESAPAAVPVFEYGPQLATRLDACDGPRETRQVLADHGIKVYVDRGRGDVADRARFAPLPSEADFDPNEYAA